MFSSNIFRALDDDIYQPMVWSLYPHRHRRPNLWTKSVALNGFEPREVQIKEENGAGGAVKLIIHAKHEEGDDFTEVKKAVKIPANVDQAKMKTIFSKDGLLILRAPYKDRVQQESGVEPLKINRVDTWNGIWGEMGRLNDHMHGLFDTNGALRLPRTEFVANEKDGGESGMWRMHVNIGPGFKQDEVKLRAVNNCVKVEARSEVKGGDGDVSVRYVCETVAIPEGVQEEELKSRFFDNGDLILEAPCKKMPRRVVDNDEGRAIPIEAGHKSADNDRMAVDN